MGRVVSARVTDRGVEVSPGGADLVFPYWSFTKTVIAICALRLAEAGRLDLDASVAGRDFTLRQLLTHTAGLPDYGTLPAYHAAVRADAEPWPRDVLLDAALAQGFLFPPGEGWSYSNIGIMLAREEVERAAGQPFAAIVEEAVAAPLGAASLALATTRQDFARVPWEGARRYHPGWVCHGCLIGTAAEAARLLHALFAGRLLRPETLAEMLVRVPPGGALPGRPWTEHGYAPGLMSGRVGRAGRAIGHSGGGPFCVNAVYHFPDRAEPVTVASFTDGRDEGVAEHAAVALSQGGPMPRAAP